jgi:hypothetical protein
MMRGVAAQLDINARRQGKDNRCRVLVIEIEHEANAAACGALLAE